MMGTAVYPHYDAIRRQSYLNDLQAQYGQQVTYGRGILESTGIGASTINASTFSPRIVKPESKPVNLALPIKKKHTMPRIIRLSLYSALVFLVWKIVFNIDSISLFVINLVTQHGR